jgi:hypothetical protein
VHQAERLPRDAPRLQRGADARRVGSAATAGARTIAPPRSPTLPTTQSTGRGDSVEGRAAAAAAAAAAARAGSQGLRSPPSRLSRYVACARRVAAHDCSTSESLAAAAASGCSVAQARRGRRQRGERKALN